MWVSRRLAGAGALSAIVISALIFGGVVAPASAEASAIVSGTVSLGSVDVAAAANVRVEYTLGGQAHNDGDFVTTAADGSYTITGLQRASYSLYFNYTGGDGFFSRWLGAYPYLDRANPADATVFDLSKNDLVDADVTLSASVSLGGTVQLGSNAAGAASVSVRYQTLTGPGVWSDESAPTFVDQYGRYTFASLRPSPYYRLHFSSVNAPNYQDDWYSGNVAVPDKTSLFEVAGDRPIIYDAVIPLKGSITGTISLGTTAARAPAGSVTVTAAASANPTVPLPGVSTTVDGQGNYTLRGLNAVPHRLTFTFGGVGSFEQITTTTVDVRAGERADATIPKLASPGIPPANARQTQAVVPTTGLWGYVSDTAGVALANVRVYANAIYKSGPSAGIVAEEYSATTGPTGRYEFTVLPADSNYKWVLFYEGSASFAAQMSGGSSYYFAPDYVNVVANKSLGTPLVKLLRGGVISGTVTSTSIPSLEFTSGKVSVEVLVSDFSSGSAKWVRTGDVRPVSSDGSYSIAGLAPDQYRVTVTYAGSLGTGDLSSSTIVVTENSRTTFNALLTVQKFPAGSLVSLANSSTVYLLDGKTNLVRLASLEVAADFGISATAGTIPSLSGYSVSAAPLSNLVGCSSARYLAAEGKLWSVIATLVSAVPYTALDATTCANLPKSSVVVRGAVLVRTPTGTIWLIDADGKRRRVPATVSPAQLSAPSAPQVLKVGSAFVAALPLGPTIIAPGTLVNTSGSTAVFLIDGLTTLVPVLSTAVAADAGIVAAPITVLASSISAMKKSTIPLSNVIICESITYMAGSGKLWRIEPALVAGLAKVTLSASTCAALPKSASAITRALLAKAASASTIYVIGPGATKRPLLSDASVAQLAAPDAGVTLTVNSSFLSALPTGATVLPVGGLIRVGIGTAIYLVNGQTSVIRIPRVATMKDFGLPTEIYSVPSLTGLTVATAKLSNFVSCDGMTWLAAAGTLHAVAAGVTGSLPITTLSAEVCKQLTRSPDVATSKLYLRALGSTAILAVVNGRKSTYTGATPVTHFAVYSAFILTIPG